MLGTDAIRLCFSLRHEVGVHFGKSMLFQGNAVRFKAKYAWQGY